LKSADRHQKVQHEVQQARQSLESRTDQLRQTAEANQGRSRPGGRRAEELG
jgi:hypothetical protein